jgi:hypothetical protein
MKTTHKVPPPNFYNEISIADILSFFKFHKKIIFVCILLGGLLGYFFEKNSLTNFEGKAYISMAKSNGYSLISPRAFLEISKQNSFYSKETILNCNFQLYDDKKNYIISDIIKLSILNNNDFIVVKLIHTNKTFIESCLNSASKDIYQMQNKLSEGINERFESEKKFMLQEFAKTNASSTDFPIMSSLILDKIQRIYDNFNPAKNSKSLLLIPISIEEQEVTLTKKLKVMLGLFLGFVFGSIVSVIKQIKVNFFQL